MTLKTMLLYLVGSREAIRDIASRPGWLWIGLLWVLSAGLAREYDGEDLLHEPWQLLIPLGASLVSSLLLFTLVFLVARRRGMKEGTFASLYRSFLALYWMTAPLAWLYAIPVERFLSPGAATQANLWLLAAVSVWRVALMIRVLVVLFEASLGAAIWTVMFFADSVVLVVLNLVPIPILAIMGGVRLTESERVLQSTAFLVGAAGFLSWPIWAIGVALILLFREPSWRLLPPAAASAMLEQQPSGRLIWGVALAGLAVWALILPVTQPEQQLRWRAERMLKSGQVAEAIALMSAHDRGDFPPHWDPPPRLAYGRHKPPLLDVMEAVVEQSASPWVMALYQEKFADSLATLDAWYLIDAEKRESEFQRQIAILEKLPNGKQIAQDFGHNLAHIAQNEDIPPSLRERVQKLTDDASAE